MPTATSLSLACISLTAPRLSLLQSAFRGPHTHSDYVLLLLQGPWCLLSARKARASLQRMETQTPQDPPAASPRSPFPPHPYLLLQGGCCAPVAGVFPAFAGNEPGQQCKPWELWEEKMIQETMIASLPDTVVVGRRQLNVQRTQRSSVDGDRGQVWLCPLLGPGRLFSETSQ